MENFRARVNPTNSSAPQLAGNASMESAHLNDLSRPGTLGTESMSTEWTDEKHSMYLKSMEASFVNQLYNSMDSVGNRYHNSFNRGHSNAHAHSGQFKVLRGGLWQKINFDNSKAQLNKQDKSHNGLLVNPWIQHFRSASKHTVSSSPKANENVVSTSQAVYLNRNDAMPCQCRAVTPSIRLHCYCCSSYQRDLSSCNNIEVSDQNFVDEDSEGKRANNMCNTKRMRKEAASSDQVVPTSKLLHGAEDVDKNCIATSN